MNTTWVGVDPGSRWTGIVGVDGKRPVTWTVIDRDADTCDHRIRVEEAIHNTLDDLGLTSTATIAIENLNPPTPHLGMVSVSELLGTALVLAWLERAFPAAILVPPGGHGHKPWAAYPPELITPGETRHAKAKPMATAGQSSRMRHARSGYDVALAAPLAARLNTARRPA